MNWMKIFAPYSDSDLWRRAIKKKAEKICIIIVNMFGCGRMFSPQSSCVIYISFWTVCVFWFCRPIAPEMGLKFSYRRDIFFCYFVFCFFFVSLFFGRRSGLICIWAIFGIELRWKGTLDYYCFSVVFFYGIYERERSIQNIVGTWYAKYS